jgi:hypothetical protein
MIKSKNKITLDSFVTYCKQNPNLRFWQALVNWSGFNFIIVRNQSFEEGTDTFYFEGRNI